MVKYLKGVFLMLFCVISLGAYSSACGASDSGAINIGVSVDNTMYDIPDTPVIVSSSNITTNSLDLLIKVGDDYANMDLDIVLTITNVDTGEVTNVSYDKIVNNSSQTTLNVSGLDPGTQYDFTVRYSLNDMNIFSADSNVYTDVTLIDPPIIDSISDVSYDSLTLDVVIDPAFAGDTMDFIVEVKNDDTGDTYTIQITQYVTSSSVALDINDLDPGTQYTFRVRYAREDSSNFSGYSNKKSIVTDLDPPTITNSQNTTTTSIELEVEVDDAFSGENMDFILHVTNKATGETFEVDFTQRVDSDGKIYFVVDGLDPGTEYDFKIRYAREGSGEFSEYSAIWTERTAYIDDEKKVTICHNGNTITINQNALDTHLGHGDYLGPCTPEGGDGGPHITPTDPGVVSGGSTDVPDDERLTKEEIRETILPEEGMAQYEAIATVGAVAGAAMAFASSAIPFFTTMPGAFGNSLFLRGLELFGVLGRRKKERKWGIVFDNVTHMPIPAAKIILSDESGKELETTYSDKDGRFGFLARDGKYKLDIFKKDHELVTDLEKDELYGDVYDGSTVEMDKDHMILVNVAMKSLLIDWAEYAKKKVKQYQSGFSTFKRYLFFGLYVLGFGWTLIVTYFYPNTFNIVLSSIYIIMFIYQTFFKKKKYGSIETNGGKPVPFAIVSLHDDESDEKKRFAVTDAIGRYYLLAENGEYKMKAKGQPVSGDSFEKQGEVKVDDGIVRKDIIV